MGKGRAFEYLGGCWRGEKGEERMRHTLGFLLFEFVTCGLATGSFGVRHCSSGGWIILL